MVFEVASERLYCSACLFGFRNRLLRRRIAQYPLAHGSAQCVFRSTNCSHAQYASSLFLATTTGYQANQRCHSSSSRTRLFSNDPLNRDIARLRRVWFRIGHFMGPLTQP
jgi:hypothetical protein